MFKRFTERARQAVVFAQDEARGLKHNYIGTEHLLLGLLREEEGLAARVLDSLDIALEEVRNRVVVIVGRGEAVPTGQIPFTPRAKKVLELALRESLALDHQYVGTEHILLGLVREPEGVAARILLDLGADADRVRERSIDFLEGRASPSTRWLERQREREVEAVAANPTRIGPSADVSIMSTHVPATSRGRPMGLLVAGVFLVALAIGLLLGYLIWH
ncbi:MAG TPA: Clp protease N-terminal domain-containing protein [Gaiellaceae bacterium]|nr:Clp protease N-terminal domain-containing protein [Gaiellaceae bacterium]